MPAPQNPAAPASRFAPHECGHSLHESMAADYSIVRSMGFQIHLLNRKDEELCVLPLGMVKYALSFVEINYIVDPIAEQVIAC